MKKQITRAKIRSKYGNPEKYTPKTVGKAIIAEYLNELAHDEPEMNGSDDTPQYTELFTPEDRNNLFNKAEAAGYVDEYMSYFELDEYLRRKREESFTLYTNLLSNICLLHTLTWSMLQSTTTCLYSKGDIAPLSNMLCGIKERCKALFITKYCIKDSLDTIYMNNMKFEIIGESIKMPELSKLLNYELSEFCQALEEVNAQLQKLEIQLNTLYGTSLKNQKFYEFIKEFLEPYADKPKDREAFRGSIKDSVRRKEWRYL